MRWKSYFNSGDPMGPWIGNTLGSVFAAERLPKGCMPFPFELRARCSDGTLSVFRRKVLLCASSGLQITGCCLWSLCSYLSGHLLAGVLIHSCNFDHGLCGWIREKDSDLHWEPIRDPAGNGTSSSTFWHCLILLTIKQNETKPQFIPMVCIPSFLGEQTW